MKFLINMFLVLSFACPAYSSLSDDLNNSFNRLGLSTNVTPADVYKGQEGSFAFGGSAYMRTQHDTVQPMWFQPPGWRIGDCDMDLWTGGFGFISSDKFVQMARRIGTSSAAYFFSLALKQVAPQVMNQMESLQEMANKINQHNIDSCESAKYFVNSGIDVIRSAANKSCQAKGTSSDSNDYGRSINAREQCNKPAEAKRLANETVDDPNFKAQAVVNKNIAWSAIQSNPTLNALDRDTKYFLMSLTGTVVISQPDGANAPTELVYLSKLDSDTSELMNALSNQGRIKIYACKNNEVERCLQIEEREIVLDAQKTIYGQVNKMLKSIEQKVIQDKALTSAEKSFIASTDFEIYKLIKLQTAFTRKVPLSFVGEYTDIIAMDLLYQYLDQCLTDMRSAFSNNQLPEKFSEKFNNMMMQARLRMQSVREMSAKKSMQRSEMRMRAQLMQSQLTANISQQVFTKMAWNKSLRSQ
jgi:conjugative transfer pilus assembly protein TraH